MGGSPILSSLRFFCVYIENGHHLYSSDKLDHHTLGEKVGISLQPNFLLALKWAVKLTMIRSQILGNPIWTYAVWPSLCLEQMTNRNQNRYVKVLCTSYRLC